MTKEEHSSSCKNANETSIRSKSLSGHKRVHNQASTSHSKLEDISNGGDRIYRGLIKDQSKPILMTTNKQDILKNRQMGFEDSICGLRENPKKSWKTFAAKFDDDDVKKVNYCSECGKRFLSLKALSGHMKCHSSVVAERDNVCKICGKGFDSMRALFGHMRHHPKKSRLSGAEKAQENCENLCPVKRKRSKTRYNKITANSHISSSSSSSVSETNEEEEAAACLIMLSSGITNWDEFKTMLNQTNDENPILRIKGQKLEVGNGELTVAVKLEEKSLDEVGLDFSNGIQKKKGNKIRTLKKIFNSGTAAKDEVNSTQLVKFEENQNPYEIENYMIKHECTICFRNFTSGRALGGHKRAHYSKQGIEKEGNDDLVFDPAPL